MPNELDTRLQSMFEEQGRGLPEEPFLANTLKLIEKKRSRRMFLRRLAYLPGIACCAFLSPFLIKGSVVMSGGLDAAFAVVNGIVNTIPGMSIAVIALLIVFSRRRQIPGSHAASGGSEV